MEVDGVLDLTFMDITDEVDLEKAVIERLNNNDMTKNSTRPKQSTPDGEHLNRTWKAIRLSNNMISELEILDEILPKHINCSAIEWIDLSFNNIKSLSKKFIERFSTLKTLYLHANSIKKLSEIKKLSLFQWLRSICLYGNPVEENKHYRNYVLYTNPTISRFDMSTVTSREKEKMEIWCRVFRNKIGQRDD